MTLTALIAAAPWREAVTFRIIQHGDTGRREDYPAPPVYPETRQA